MKPFFPSGLALVLLLLTPASAAEWKQVWADEFDQEGAPDPGKWAFEEGYVRNDEAQYYTANRKENARVENGHLVIEARKEKFPLLPSAPRRNGRDEADITSASLITRGKAEWTYGRYEVRAKLPTGRGVWPAIWMLGTSIDEVGWPTCGEIDIMEYVGFEPDVVHVNVHTSGFNHLRNNGRGARLTVPDAGENFHIYSVEWTPESIRFAVDGKEFFHLDNDGTGKASWPFDEPHYLILNFAVGGAWGGQKGIDETIFPQKFLIDYVRVFEKAATAVPEKAN